MAHTENTDRFLRTRDWAKRLDISIEQVEAMAAAGELPEPALAFEGSLRWTEDQYAAWSTDNTTAEN